MVRRGFHAVIRGISLSRVPLYRGPYCKEIYKFYHPQTNGMVERLNHTLCQMLSYLIADDQKNWDEMLMHAVAAHNNVSRGTWLAPNEVHIGDIHGYR